MLVATLGLAPHAAWAGCFGGGATVAPTAPPPVVPPVLTEPSGANLDRPVLVSRTYHFERRRHWDLFMAGAYSAGALGVASIVSALVSEEGYRAIPFVGPAIAATRTSSTASVALLSVDSALQIGGLVLALTGAFTHHQERVPDPPAPALASAR